MTASLLIVGRGRMGRLVEALAPEYEFSVAGTVDIDNAAQPESWPKADVAIDFSLAEAVPQNFPVLAGRGMNIVIGATGWQAQESRLRAEAEARGVGVVAAPNFAIGVNLFLALTERAAGEDRAIPRRVRERYRLRHRVESQRVRARNGSRPRRGDVDRVTIALAAKRGFHRKRGARRRILLRRMVQLVQPCAECRLVAPQLCGPFHQSQEQVDPDREVRRRYYPDPSRVGFGPQGRLCRLPSGRTDHHVHAAGSERGKVHGHCVGEREVDRDVGLWP